jgi:methylmalonyl-CoA/ethylmalonyl-CoA epimerase
MVKRQADARHWRHAGSEDRMRVSRIDQIAIVVDDLEAAVAKYERQYGLVVAYREVIEDAAIEEAMIDIGGVWLQLIAPTSPDSVVAGFLRDHGPGLHHIGFGVDDVAGAIAALRAAGATPRTELPQRGGGGHTIAFIEPDEVDGVLVELVQDEGR